MDLQKRLERAMQFIPPDEQTVWDETWEDETTGLTCRIIRNPDMFMLCGYVAWPSGLDLCLADDLYVHGGITFQGPFDEEGKETRWVGFDCGHHGDLVPTIAALMGSAFEPMDRVYRTVDFVREQCAFLAAQIHDLMTATPGQAPGPFEIEDF